MKRKRDPYTLFLPFDEQDAAGQEEQRDVILERLGRYLAAGRSAPKRMPLLRLLPSLNNSQAGERAIKFSEQEAAELLAQLGATLEPNPHYLGRSNYRVTIPLELIERAITSVKDINQEKDGGRRTADGGREEE
jgi:hypothetical protein